MQNHVLVVSEKDQVTKRFSKFFKTYGCAVRCAGSASESIAAIGEGAPDLILCDGQLDVISADELIDIFKRHRRTARIPVLLIKEGSVSLQALESLDLRVKVDGIVPFPCADQVLADVVDKWLAEGKRRSPVEEILRSPLEPAPANRPLPTWRHGTIDVLSLSRLFYRLCCERETGVLNLLTGQRRMKAAIDDGQLVGVNSNYLREDTLGRFLVGQGRLTPHDAEQAFRRSREAGVPYGQMLVEMSLLTAAEREAFVAAHMRQKLCRAFAVGWSAGRYDFSRQRAGGVIPRMSPEPLGRLFRHSLLTTAPLNEIHEAFDRAQKTAQPISLTDECEQLTELFCLDAAAQRLCQWIHGKSLDEIRRLATPQTELLVRLAFLLIVARAARFADGPVPPLVPPAARVAPPAVTAPAEPARDAPPQRFAEADIYRRALTDGRTYFSRDEQALAVPHFLKALEINPDSSEALSFLAMAKFNLGGKRDIAVAVEAKEQLKRAVALDDHNDTAHLFLGQIFKHEGKTMLAETYFKKAHTLNPLNDEARREVTLIRIKRRQQRDLGLT